MARTMDMTLTYTNHLGQTVTVGDGALHWLGTDLLSHEWSYEADGQRAWGLRLGARTFELAIGMMGGSLAERTALYRALEADAVNGRPGTLSWRGYNLTVIPVASSLDNWWFDDGIEERTVRLLAPRPLWTHDVTQQFRTTDNDNVESVDLDYAYEYAHDWMAPQVRSRPLKVDTMGETEFRLVVYGPATDPYVTIAGNRYEVAVSVPAGSRLELDTRDRTIRLVGRQGDVTNCYAQRTRGIRGGGSYAFQPLPRGLHEVLCDGTFGFDVVIHDERTEPAWEA